MNDLESYSPGPTIEYCLAICAHSPLTPRSTHPASTLQTKSLTQEANTTAASPRRAKPPLSRTLRQA